MSLRIRKQTSIHIQRRVESVRQTKAKWPEERIKLFKQRVSANSKAGTSEARFKNSLAHKGQIAWNKGIKCPQLSGEKHGMYGKHHTPEAIEKNRRAHLDVKQSSELIKKRIDARRGYKHSIETKEKIKKTNLETWAQEEIRLKNTGSNSPSWRGGISFIPYPAEWTKLLRHSIKQRDDYQCQYCGKDKIKLAVHHIDYNKKNLNPTNLITLCIPCHMKTNYKRWRWKSILKKIVNRPSSEKDSIQKLLEFREE